MTRAPRIDVVLASVPHGEIRLIANLIPFVAARLEHRPFCPFCTGSGHLGELRDHRYCEECDGEGYGPVYEDCLCSDCRRLEHVCQPGCDVLLSALGISEESVVAERVAASLEAA